MLPSLDAAQPTIHALHTVARLLGALCLLVFEHQPNYLELGLAITPNGLSTDLMPAGGKITLDFAELALIYQPASGASEQIKITGKSQITLLEAILQTVYRRELGGLLGDAQPTAMDAMFTAVAAFTNRIKPKPAELTDTVSLHFDTQHASDYAQALYSIFTGVSRFRARLNGSMSPVVVWPEHFDLSFLWFASDPDEQHPHLNFGFAPYSTGIDQPYLYAYAYPYPDHFDPPSLPSGAMWNTAGWTGVVVPYSEIARQAAPEIFVEQTCLDIFRTLQPLLPRQ